MPEQRDTPTPSEPVVVRKRPLRTFVPMEDEPLRRRVVPYIIILAFAAILGLGSESVRSVEAVVAAAAFPLVVMVLGLGPLRLPSTWLSRTAIAGSLVVVLAAEFLVFRQFYPSKALAATSVSQEQPEATVAVPDSKRRFEVLVRGKLHGDTGEAEARYDLSLSRAERTARVEGAMTRHVGSAPQRMVGGARGGGTASLESGRYEVELDAPGPVVVRLLHLGTGARRSLEVSIFARELAEKTVGAGFFAGILALFVVQALAVRQALKTRLSGAAAVVAVYSLYVRRYLNPDDPLLTILPAMVVSIVLGGLTGIALGKVAGLFSRGKSV